MNRKYLLNLLGAVFLILSSSIVSNAQRDLKYVGCWDFRYVTADESGATMRLVLKADGNVTRLYAGIQVHHGGNQIWFSRGDTIQVGMPDVLPEFVDNGHAELLRFDGSRLRGWIFGDPGDTPSNVRYYGTKATTCAETNEVRTTSSTRQLPKQQVVNPTRNLSDNDAGEQERADERTRLFNQQKGKTTVINPDSSVSEKLVRMDGESDEEFRTRERSAAYEAQKKAGKNDSAWTEEDGKKYTQGKKGRWIVGSFKATSWGSDRMFRVTSYVTAYVVNENGQAASKWTFLEIRNSSQKYPVYYGLSGVFNKMLEPGQTVTEDLHMYRAFDPAKRAKEPDTVVDIMVKYWVEAP